MDAETRDHIGNACADLEELATRPR
jgi:hypothetical protein